MMHLPIRMRSCCCWTRTSLPMLRSNNVHNCCNKLQNSRILLPNLDACPTGWNTKTGTRGAVCGRCFRKASRWEKFIEFSQKFIIFNFLTLTQISGFEQCGHIVHLNLRDPMLPFRYVVGQILLDKNPSAKCVKNWGPTKLKMSLIVKEWCK